jgi:hypothetical protein
MAIRSLVSLEQNDTCSCEEAPCVLATKPFSPQLPWAGVIQLHRRLRVQRSHLANEREQITFALLYYFVKLFRDAPK